IAQKILSCVVRVRESFGAVHVAAVLSGERSRRILDRHHETLSTFGLLAGQAGELRGWIAQLVACGALVQEGHPRPILRLGPAARPILRGETDVRLVETGSASVRGGGDEWAGVDPGLFEALRAWRREAAAARGVAPFIILGDHTLRQLAAIRPSSIERLRSVTGIGEARLSEHGRALMQVIDESCAAHELERDVKVSVSTAPRQRPQPSRISAAKGEAIRLLQQGMAIEEVMGRTGRARSTVIGDLSEIIESGSYRPSSLRPWVTEESEASIRRAAAEAGVERLKPIKEIVGENVSYDDIHIVVASIRGTAAG
ncbi:MAG: recQ, partial [Acidobacteria bacterium]|nr:recQ [Acidobacteriota bacterium]